ncbi:tetratricopeptide repeat protein [Pandoraea sputorum]|uniref:tetratricopeptide repeat protein n=1 Tax=Pandoraea sputorum TaxID=93222 RepID=UPI002AF6A8CD|nr:hypothetical protein [Pandoraea sputorum]
MENPLNAPATQLSDQDVNSLLTLAHIYGVQGLYRHAYDALTIAFGARPDDQKIARSLGMTLIKIGRFREAILPLHVAVRASDNAADAETTLRYGECLARSGFHNAARKVFLEAMIGATRGLGPPHIRRQAERWLVRLESFNNVIPS